MKNFCFILVLLLFLPASLWAQVTKDGKITICHGTSSSTNPYNEISVSLSAWNEEASGLCAKKSTHCLHKYEKVKTAGGVEHPDFALNKSAFTDCKSQYLASIAPAKVAAVISDAMVECLSTKTPQFKMEDGSIQDGFCPGVKDVPVGEGEHNYIRLPAGATSLRIASVKANMLGASISYYKESDANYTFFTKSADGGVPVSEDKFARIDVAGAPDFEVDCSVDSIASYGRIAGGTPWNPLLGFSEKTCPDSGILNKSALFSYFNYAQILCPDDGNVSIRYIDPTVSTISSFHSYDCEPGNSLNLNLDIIPLDN